LPKISELTNYRQLPKKLFSLTKISQKAISRGMNIVNETNQFLKKSGWTQKQLAAELGIHPVSLSKFMRDKRKIKSIGEKLYDFLISEKMRENENSLPS